MTDHESVKRFPLEWPIGWKRTAPRHRQRAAFMQTVTKTERRANQGQITDVQVKREQQVSIPTATARLEQQLERLGATQPVLSTNMPLRLDGRPRSEKDPDDPGAAVYFRLHGKPLALACDRWNRLADNIAALAQHIDAIRRIDRYGVGTMDQAFAGYRSLPADTAADWRAVFGFAKDSRPSVEQVDRAYKTAAKQRHPDVGGSEIEMAHLNRARDYALMELEPQPA